MRKRPRESLYGREDPRTLLVGIAHPTLSIRDDAWCESSPTHPHGLLVTPFSANSISSSDIILDTWKVICFLHWHLTFLKLIFSKKYSNSYFIYSSWNQYFRTTASARSKHSVMCMLKNIQKNYLHLCIWVQYTSSIAEISIENTIFSFMNLKQ